MVMRLLSIISLHVQPTTKPGILFWTTPGNYLAEASQIKYYYNTSYLALQIKTPTTFYLIIYLHILLQHKGSNKHISQNLPLHTYTFIGKTPK